MTTTMYSIQAHTRECAASGRALQPGERYYSVLFDEAGQFIRKDYSKEAWNGAPQSALAFWSGRVPVVNEKRRPVFDDDLLIECFARLAEETESARLRFRYVVGLLLLRRKRLKFENLRRDGELEYLQLRCAKTGCEFELLDPRMPESETAAIQNEVFKLLGWK
jgi:hypothetical protein